MLGSGRCWLLLLQPVVSADDGVCLLGTGLFLSRATDAGTKASTACAGGVVASMDGAALHACVRLSGPDTGDLRAVTQDCNCGPRIKTFKTGMGTAAKCSAACDANAECKAFGLWTDRKKGQCALFKQACPTALHPEHCASPLNATKGFRNEVFNRRSSPGGVFEKIAGAHAWGDLGLMAVRGASRLHLAVDPRDNAVVFEDAVGAHRAHTALYKWRPGAGSRELVAEAPLGPVSGLAVGQDGAVFASFARFNCVVKFPPGMQPVLDFINAEVVAGPCAEDADARLADPARLLAPTRLALDAEDRMYVAEGLRARVVRCAPACETVAGRAPPEYTGGRAGPPRSSELGVPGGGLGQLGTVADLAVGPDSSVFVYDIGRDQGGRVLRWTHGASAGELVAGGLAADAEFGFLSVAPDGTVYAAGMDSAGRSSAVDLHQEDAKVVRYRPGPEGRWAAEPVVSAHALNGLDVRTGELYLGLGTGATSVFRASELLDLPGP